MAVPKRRMSRSRQGNRRSHHHVAPKQVAYCSRCGDPIRPHYACSKCGYSNIQRREVVLVEAEEES